MRKGWGPTNVAALEVNLDCGETGSEGKAWLLGRSMVSVSELWCSHSARLLVPLGRERDPHGNSERLGLESTGEGTPHRVRRLLLHGGGDVGVGVQGESCRIMAQHGGEGFHIHAVLQGQHRKCVTKVCQCQARTNKFLKFFR